MSENFKQNNLWNNQESEYTCNGNARILIEAAQKNHSISGVILEVFAGIEDPDIDVSHCYVVLNNQNDDELALNQQNSTSLITAKEARERGIDITDEILNASWDELG